MLRHNFLVLLGGLLVLAFLAEEAYSRFRFPPVLALMVCGLALGPGLHLVPVEDLTGVAPQFGALALLLIVFEGGLDLDLDSVIRRLAPGLKLAVAGFALGILSGTVLLRTGGASWTEAVTFAAVLAPISGAIVLPLASRIGFRDEVRTLVVLEASLADVLGVLTVGVIAKVSSGGGVGGILAAGSLVAALLSVALGVGLGLVWPRVLRGMGEKRFIDALTFGVALVLWGAVNLAGTSGVLAVLAFGLTLANEREILRAIGLDPTGVAPVAEMAVARLHGFVGELTFVVRAFFFVFLGVMVRFDQIGGRRLAEAFAFVLLVTALRWLILRHLERRKTLSFLAGERRAVWMLQPRGLVSAVLAVEAGRLGIASADEALGMASVAIVLTNVMVPFGLRGFALASSEEPDGRA